MALQKALGRVGVARQTAFGTAIANPQFAHGIIGSGDVITIAPEREMVALTSGKRISPQVDRNAVVAGFNITTRLFTRSTPLWLWAALGGNVTTGAGPYVHTVTDANVPPYLTVWGSLDGQLVNVRDCVVDQLEISFDGANPPEMTVSGMGTIANFAPTFVPGVDDTLGSYFRSAGGTFALDSVGTTTAAAAITKGSLKLNNNVARIQVSGSVVPNEHFVGRQDIEASFTAIPPTNFNDWREILTGTTSGTTVAEIGNYGAFAITFVDPTTAGHQLAISATRSAFHIAWPQTDAGGGPVELEYEGMIVQPASGATLTAATTNAVTSY